MNPLEAKIAEKIKKEGPIPFATFMEIALYEPGLGYYMSENTEIGKAGDFYTSQHVHPAFGRMIAKQLEEMWQSVGKPTEFFAIEAGAGAGLLCLDILESLKRREIYDALSYAIVEMNPSLRERQQNLLSPFADKVTWLSSLNEKQGVVGCIVSNELLDAFPVHLIETTDKIQEVYVDVMPDKEESEIPFREVIGPPSTRDICGYLDEFSIRLPKGYRTEINLRIREWLHAASDALSKGFILTIDYGYSAREYYSPERNRGTLLCYAKHRVHENPYLNVGRQDITAHVNFSSVKKWGETVGFKTLGFCKQGTYLVSLGIDRVIQDLFHNSPDYLFEVARIKRLIFPGTFGETHSVMVQYKGENEPRLRGFAMKNDADVL